MTSTPLETFLLCLREAFLHPYSKEAQDRLRAALREVTDGLVRRVR